MRLLFLTAAVLACTSACAQLVPSPETQAAAAQAHDDAAQLARQVPPQELAFRYESGTLLDGLAAVYDDTHDATILRAIQTTVDRWVDTNGKLTPEKPFHPDKHALDDLEPGRAILWLYQHTHAARYRKAAAFLYAQFATQPRTPEGGFWHKQVYPQQMWLDGAYMAEPFRAAYAREFRDSEAFDHIAVQFTLMYDHLRDPQTGLLHHGWDAAHAQPWADKSTGESAEAWARADGWYMMALVDTLPNFPPTHPGRAKLMRILNELAAAIAKQQDAATGAWFDVLARNADPGNFTEPSATAMFTYALAKGVRLGYLPPRFQPIAVTGWAALTQTFLARNPDGTLTLHGTVKVSGLGGKPYRAGDYSYYIHEPVGDDDPKGLGATLLAASEIERLK